MAEKRPRGVCCHEAGHAVVAHSYRLRVQMVRVAFSEAKGWHGGTDLPLGSPDHLDVVDQLAIWTAGKDAEDVLKCPAHETAWFDDLGQIAAVLSRKGIPEDQHWPLITEARERARAILMASIETALSLTERLVECGRVERDELLRLIQE